MEPTPTTDPWWWNSDSAFPSPPSPDEAFYDVTANGGAPGGGGAESAHQALPVQTGPGESVYRYGLSRDLKMESVQVFVDGFEARDPAILADQLCVSVQLMGCMGELVPTGPLLTGCSTTASPKFARWSNELLTFPFKVGDLNEDSVLYVNLYAPPAFSHSRANVVIGGAIFPLFTREGRLRTGKQEIEIFAEPIPMHKQTQVQREEMSQRAWSTTTVLYEKEESIRKQARRMEPNWLNRLAEDRLSQVRRLRRLRLSEASLGVLAIELVDFGIPIVFEPAEGGDPANQVGQNLLEDYDGARSFTGSELIYPDVSVVTRTQHIRNVVEAKCYAMRRAFTRKSAGDEKPNVEERDRIERILNSLMKPTSEEEDILWKFRHSLVRYSKALTKVLASVKWDDADEVAQVTKLLDRWESAHMSDVLRLLSGEPEFSHPVVRSYAVKVLSQSGNAVLLLYMPQLVQALRYDQLAVTVGKGDSATATRELGPLQRFLVAKCSTNEELASCFHWLLKVECLLAKQTSSSSLSVFQPIFDAFRDMIHKYPHVQRAIAIQDEFVGRIMNAARTAANSSGKVTDRTKVLLAMLDKDSGPLPEPIPLAGFPGRRIVRMKKESARIIKSKTFPAVIDFTVIQTVGGDQQQQSTHQHQGAQSKTLEDSMVMSLSRSSIVGREQNIRVMFKVGDDLRQDQLVIQLIELMDNVFRENGLDLEMTIYRVLATAPQEGFVEFVADAVTLSKVMNEFGSITAFLMKEEHLFGGRKAVLERFIRSCAGYAVATYVLGIGDRHLDNIMIRPNGHMFHIDFGYTFGRDPKLFSVPVRILPQMIETMGSEGEFNFRRHCWEALKSLRSQAALILSVVGLMVDANIPDLSKLQMPSNVLAGIQERLMLGLSDDDAEKSINTIIDQSIAALGPRLNERIHQLAQQLL